MKFLIGKISVITGLALLHSFGYNPTSSAVLKIKTVQTDNCAGPGGGVPLIAATLDGDANSYTYYFPVGTPTSSAMLSELELALSTGLSVLLKYESTSSTTAGCFFNPGKLIYSVSVNP